MVIRKVTREVSDIRVDACCNRMKNHADGGMLRLSGLDGNIDYISGSMCIPDISYCMFCGARILFADK